MTWTITPHSPDGCQNTRCGWHILWWDRRQDRDGKTIDVPRTWRLTFRSRGDAEAYMAAHDSPPPPPLTSNHK